MLFGVLVFVGAVQSVMLGMLYKIVPFLVWLHSRNHPQGVHNMNQVLSARRVRGHLWVHGLALALLVLASLYPSWARPAGVLYALSAALLAANLAGAVSRLRARPVHARSRHRSEAG